MPDRGFSRFVPLLVIFALIAALAAVYGPGMLRAWKFRTTVNALLADIEAGNVRNIPSYVLPAQKAQITALVMLPLLSHYTSEIGSLKLTSYYREDNHVWAVVTGKQKDGSLLGQGKLRWEWDGKQWQFDVLSSYVTAGLAMADDRNAVNIGKMIDNALNGKKAPSFDTDNPFAP